jgi:hypothetical protein
MSGLQFLGILNLIRKSLPFANSNSDFGLGIFNSPFSELWFILPPWKVNSPLCCMILLLDLSGLTATGVENI